MTIEPSSATPRRSVRRSPRRRAARRGSPRCPALPAASRRRTRSRAATPDAGREGAARPSPPRGSERQAEGRHRLAGDAFAAAGEAELLGGGGLDADAPRIDAEDLG